MQLCHTYSVDSKQEYTLGFTKTIIFCAYLLFLAGSFQSSLECGQNTSDIIVAIQPDSHIDQYYIL